MTYKAIYQAWLEDDSLDAELHAELEAIKNDEVAIKERFIQPLAFGTGGMRGVMGAGINRINNRTIEKATAGLACYLLEQYGSEAVSRGVAVAYDSRHYSAQYAETCGCVLAAYGIKAYIFSQLTPTPVLSFAVMDLNCVAGIVITASHNPKEYNGYKVYDEFGCQLTLKPAQELMTYVARFEDNSDLPILSTPDKAVRDGLWQWIDGDLLKRFEQAVLSQSLLGSASSKAQLKIVYTPLHGTGLKPVSEVLRQAGFSDLHLLEAQMEPNGDFPTVMSPNPEEKEALKMAIAYGETIGADLILGTDPDCDRIGVAVNDGEQFVLLSGNQVGALLCDFVLRHRELTPTSTLIKTIVTSDLGAAIAKHYGVQVLETLTGFKFIGELMTRFAHDESHNFVMGYEESYGYLIGEHAKDKDAVVAALLISEMAAEAKANGYHLQQKLTQLYEQYGYYLDEVHSFTLSGLAGQACIGRIMDKVRRQGQALFGAQSCKDYAAGVDDLPQSDVVKFFFDEGGWLAIRPSGTEPKIKFYFSLKGNDSCQAQEKLQILLAQVTELVEKTAAEEVTE